MATEKRNAVDVKAVAAAIGAYPSFCEDCRGWPDNIICVCGKWSERAEQAARLDAMIALGVEVTISREPLTGWSNVRDR